MMKDATIGSRLNRYEIRESIHRSDLIGIYKAYDTKLERLVLLKTILHSADYSQEAVDFFIAESRSLAKLTHPNIAKVLDFGYENGNLYLISEYVTGKPLSELMDEPMSWQRAVNILLPLMDALIYAHSKEIIHRDLKPENITINNDGQPTLSDFSLIRIIEEEETRDMTGTNVGLGSAAYISPEQGKGLTVDFRADIYSLGVIFFEMVTGKKLFYAANSMEIVLQHIMANPPRPRSIIPNLPKPIEDAILSALSKDPDKRYQTMEAFSDALKAFVDESNKIKSKPKPSLGLRIASVAGLILIVGIIYVIGVWQTSTVALPTQLPHPLTGISTVTPTEVRATPTIRTVIPTTTQTLEIDTFPTYDLPSIPVLPGTALPISNVISSENAVSVKELARWGIPEVYQLIFTKDDNTLLAATSAGVYYLDPKDLSPRLFLSTESKNRNSSVDDGRVTTFSISRDGELIATGNEKGALAVWNINNGTGVHFYTHNAGILSIDISPDKSKLVFSDTKNNIYRWNFDQSEPVMFSPRHTKSINKVVFETNENVISGSADFKIRTWDVSSGVDLTQHTASKQILDMAISPDGKTLAIALNIGKIEIWDMNDLENPNSTPANNITNTTLQIPVTHIAFLPDNKTIAAGSDDGTIRIWDVNTREKLWETPPRSKDEKKSPGKIKTLAISNTKTDLVVMFDNGLIERWDITGKELKVSREFKHEDMKRIAISENDSLVAIQNGAPVKGAPFKGDSFVQILSSRDASQIATIPGALPRGNPFSSNSKTFIIQSNILELELYSLSNTTIDKLFTLFDFPLEGSVTYLPDNSIVTASGATGLSYWSTSSGRELKVENENTQSHIKGLCRVFYRRDGSVLAAGSANGTIYVDKNLERFCSVPRRPGVNSEDFFSDGSIIAISAKNSPIIDVWDLQNSDQKKEFKSNSLGYVLDVAISKDGKLLASVSTDGFFEIYNMKQEKQDPINTIYLNTGEINQVMFSNNGKYIILGSTDGTLRFFGLYP